MAAVLIAAQACNGMPASPTISRVWEPAAQKWRGEGAKFKNLENARKEAVASGRELAADWPLSGNRLASISIKVADEVGNTIFVAALEEVLQLS